MSFYNLRNKKEPVGSVDRTDEVGGLDNLVTVDRDGHREGANEGHDVHQDQGDADAERARAGVAPLIERRDLSGHDPGRESRIHGCEHHESEHHPLDRKLRHRNLLT